jgi:glycosyltransferase 2 family protein
VPAIGYSVSAASLTWVFWRFPWSQLADHLRTLQWNWVAFGVLLELAVYWMDAWRWREMLKPVGSPSFGYCLEAVFVGLLANDILPAKAGELVRCYLLTRETGVPLPVTITSDVILRFMDGLWMVIVYLIITWQISSHTEVTRGMWVFGCIAVAGALLLLYVLFRRQHAREFVNAAGWAARFRHLLDEIHQLGSWPALRRAMAISGLYWVTQVLAIWALTKADRFDLGLSAAAFLLVVRSVATLLPNAPANVGTYQLALSLALEMYLFVEHGNAQALAEILFIFLTLPAAIGGAIALVMADIDLFTLHHGARRAKSAADRLPA